MALVVCILVSILFFSAVNLSTATRVCSRLTGPTCNVVCNVSEQQAVNFSVISVSSVLGLDIETLGWEFEVINRTSELPYPVDVNPATGEVLLPLTVDFDTDPRPGVVFVTVQGTPVSTTRPNQDMIPAVGTATTCTIQIRTLDVDDNNPRLDESVYQRTVYVPEDTALGTVVARFPIIDGDSGILGQWRLIRVEEGTGIEAPIADPLFRGIGVFDVDNVTGDVTLISPLNVEVNQSYEIAVIVRPSDFDPDLNYPAVFFDIQVMDVNEYRPDVIIQPLMVGNITVIPVRHEVEEGVTTSQVLFQATVTDRDLNARPVMTVEGGLGMFRARSFPGGLWWLFADPVLDRETVGIYNLTLAFHEVNSSPNGSLATRLNYTVTVLDRNDNTPSFTQDTYMTEIPETLGSGTAIIQVTASDPDLDDEVSYAISAVDTSNTVASEDTLDMLNITTLFEISQETGIIRLTRSLDFEDLGAIVFEVRVTAISSRNTSHTGTALVLIQLLDRNDEVPEFTQGHYMFDVQENGAGQASVGTVQAPDRDAGRNGRVFYSIEDSDIPDETTEFRIDPVSGLITTVGPFDREIKDSYSFIAVATDDALNSSERRRGVAQVTVCITDQNDNPPRFTSPPQTIAVATDVAAGASIYQFSTTDNDSTISPLAYSVQAQKLSQRNIISFQFEMSTDGRLLARNSLATLSPGDYPVIVRAEDTTNSALFDERVITLNVTNPVPLANSSSSTNLTLVIIVVVAAVAACLILAVVFVFCYLRLKKKHMTEVALGKAGTGKTNMVFHNNLYDTEAKIGNDLIFSRPGTLPIGSRVVDGLASTPRSDPEGSAFTPGSFNESGFMGKSRNRSAIYEPHSSSEKTPNSRESYYELDRRQSVRTSTSFVDDPDIAAYSSSGGRQSGGLSTIEPSPTTAGPSARLPQNGVRQVSHSAELSHRPRPVQIDSSKSAMHIRRNEVSNSPRSGLSTRSQSFQYSATPPTTSAQSRRAEQQPHWQPMNFKAPVATPALTNNPVVKEYSNGSTPTAYRSTPPSRQRSYSTSHSYGEDTIEPTVSSEHLEADDMHFYPAGYRPRSRRPGSSSQNSSHSAAGVYEEQRHVMSDPLNIPLPNSPPIVIEMGESDML